jgi:hypothetical protein
METLVQMNAKITFISIQKAVSQHVLIIITQNLILYRCSVYRAIKTVKLARHLKNQVAQRAKIHMNYFLASVIYNLKWTIVSTLMIRISPNVDLVFQDTIF